MIRTHAAHLLSAPRSEQTARVDVRLGRRSSDGKPTR
jgi:hypothetical protein